MAKAITHLPSGGVIARDETPLRYIALQPFRLGDRFTEPGEELTADQLEGRSIGSMIRAKHIQQVIKPVQRRTRTRKTASR